MKQKRQPRRWAEAVFALWKYGQSAYVPSVAQMRLLYAARGIINPVIEKCGGDRCPPRARRVLVLDIDGGGRTADSQSMALLDSQRSHAGNAQDAGA